MSARPDLAARSPFDLPRAEARARLARGVPVFVPINPVEYHGPHLSLRNDALVSQGLIADLARRLAPDEPILALPDLAVGVDPCPGPGTVETSLRRVAQDVDEACRALCELGARRVLLVTFHGAPLHAVALARGIARCAAYGAHAVAPLSAAQRLLMEVHAAQARGQTSTEARRLEAAVEHVRDEAERARLLRGIPLDFHAGFVETSIALHYAPSSVRSVFRTLPDCPEIRPDPAVHAAARVARRLGQEALALELELAALGRGWYALRPFPGYTGAPRAADPAAGRALAELLIEFMLDLAERVFAGEPHPPPLLGWLRFATLGGALPTHQVRPGDVLRV